MVEEIDISKVENVVNSKELRFYNDANLPPKPVFCSNNPTKVQESPLDARSPQEVLEYHGMYRDPSYYENNPEKIYMDLTQFDDYETYLNNVNSMKERFNNLPIDIRAKFNHNPAELFAYVQSKEFNVEKLMDDKTLNNYRKIKREEELKKKFEDYQKTPEYQQSLKDAQLRAQFAEKQYQDWLSKNNLSSKDNI